MVQSQYCESDELRLPLFRQTNLNFLVYAKQPYQFIKMSDGWGAPDTTAAAPERAAAPPMSEADRQAALDKWGTRTANVYSETEAQLADRKWGGNAAVYEWDGDEGDIGPENPELEVMLFGPPEERHGTAGLDISK